MADLLCPASFSSEATDLTLGSSMELICTQFKCESCWGLKTASGASYKLQPYYEDYSPPYCVALDV
ncbi:hypothetical protein E2C01_057986 [Portunus trituberculatus]|uniref:Uncharacterized protein n=1 Tax=Portunus trituberculatus TaxID=210409 RepID=A0A5B7H436_PORTR|nr:hypothetical protein [Portunus trituberculatus]